MAIITVSHDSYSFGKKTAEVVAQELGYECLGAEIIHLASQELHLSDRNLITAIHDSPSIKDSLVASKERTIAKFRAAFYDYMLRDNIIYHGWAGHIFLSDVPNVFKVRLVTDMEDRIREEIRREGISVEEAVQRIREDDEERAEWTRSLYGRDNHDPKFYNLYINLHGINVDRAAQIIINSNKAFTNGHVLEMKTKLKDLVLEAKVEAKLLEIFPEIEVQVRNGVVYGQAEISILQEPFASRKAKKALANIEGIKAIHIGAKPSCFVPFG